MDKKFLNKDILTLSFENSCIYIAEGKFDGKKIKIKKAIPLRLSEDIYNNGLIIDKEAVRIKLLDVFRINRFKSKQVVATLESTEILTREINLEDAPSEEIKSLIEFEMNKQLLIEVENYIIKYKDIEISVKEGKKNVIFAVTAMPKKIVRNLFYFLTSCKLQPLKLESNDISLASIMSLTATAINQKPKEGETTNRVFLAYNQDNIKLKMVKNCEVRFSRVIKYEDIEGDMLKVQELQELKGIGTDVIQKDKKYSAAIQNIDKIFSDINMVFRYYTGLNKKNTIEVVFLHGELTSKSTTIEKYISDRLDKNAMKFNFIYEVVDIKEDPLVYLHNFGALLNVE